MVIDPNWNPPKCNRSVRNCNTPSPGGGQRPVDMDLAKVGYNLVKCIRTGEMVELRSLWQEQDCVIFFLRRFGCQVCRWTAREISRLKEAFEQNGVHLAGVGPEELGVKDFMEGQYFKGDLYIDERKQCYKDLGFKRYNTLNLLPAALSQKVRQVATQANKDGISGNFSGDVMQSGGLLIVSKDLTCVGPCRRQMS
ncbi:prostamide/prostaglandin F synthase isoform X2 [Pristis pectinata]|uniref:prostamide/prostaglandin F synthase isoform X2 n=1 Tax=Pristis pectinata TaxID=685728 RepID=UPI00223E4CE1|nr:prostamide/prostaglandin F synthase isoform X2 [Pristis pectinata]